MADESEYFERLASLLEQHDFGWVVSQAQVEIEDGKTVAKDVQAPELIQVIESDSFVRRTPRRRRASLIATQPYDDAERLAILLRAIETAIVDRADLEKAVLDAVGDIPLVEFQPDDGGALRRAGAPDRGSHRLERGRLAGGNELRTNLAEVLSQLREIVDARA